MLCLRTLWPRQHTEEFVWYYGSRGINVHHDRGKGCDWRNIWEISWTTIRKQKEYAGNKLKLWNLKSCPCWFISSHKATFSKLPQRESPVEDQTHVIIGWHLIQNTTCNKPKTLVLIHIINEKNVICPLIFSLYNFLSYTLSVIFYSGLFSELIKAVFSGY